MAYLVFSVCEKKLSYFAHLPPCERHGRGFARAPGAAISGDLGGRGRGTNYSARIRYRNSMKKREAPTKVVILVADGARWVNRRVVVDRRLVTGRKSPALPQFNAAMLKAFTA